MTASLTRYVYSELHKRGMYGGLWTSTGMPNIAAEVGVAGSRVCKTDVGWIGAGYKYVSDEVELRVDCVPDGHLIAFLIIGHDVRLGGVRAVHVLPSDGHLIGS